MSLGITVYHLLASLVIFNSIPRYGFFYPTLSPMIDSYIIQRVKTSSYIGFVCAICFTEHEILTAFSKKMLKNKDYPYFQTLSCCIGHAY